MFSGFTPETVDFLWGIRMNNNRDWFQEHKKQYVDTLYDPMKELGQQLFQPFRDRPGCVLKVSRIYRDARMHPPTPYKESLWISIRQESEWWAQHPCLYFEITPDGASYGFFFWQPSTAYMEVFRRQLAANPRPFLELLERTQAETGVDVTAECYKRPKPTDNPALEPYFAWKGAIGCTRELPPGPELFDPKLSGTVEDFFRKLIPLYEYFSNLR